MLENQEPYCPECAETVEPAAVDRRDFMRVLGGSALALSMPVAGSRMAAHAAADKPKLTETPSKPAEELVKELYASLSAEQKKEIVLPWDHGAGKDRIPTRAGMYNAAILGKKIGTNYTRAQQELIERILRAMSAGEDGYRRISRGGTWDTSGSIQNCGALIFGEPVDRQKYSWVFTGHHLTVRCDGNSEEGAAFGGPMYYGHSPNGYSDRNVFNFQTRSVLSAFDALSEKQRKVAVLPLDPKANNEGAKSVRLLPARAPKPGLSFGEMNKDQQELVVKVMHDLVSPFRKEEGDEVMDIVKSNGGLEKIHLAFYQDADVKDNQRWHFWRLVGPGFVWNYRVLPHVHCYVNISSKV